MFNRYMVRLPSGEPMFFDHEDELLGFVRTRLRLADVDPLPGFEQMGFYIFAYNAVRGDKPDTHTGAVQPEEGA